MKITGRRLKSYLTASRASDSRRRYAPLQLPNDLRKEASADRVGRNCDDFPLSPLVKEQRNLSSYATTRLRFGSFGRFSPPLASAACIRFRIGVIDQGRNLTAHSGVVNPDGL